VDDYGIGLSNTAARLAELQRGAGTLNVTRSAEGGTRSALRLPLG
jgi:hypothetical protein